MVSKTPFVPRELKTVYNLILFHSKSVKILTRYFLIFNMNFNGTDDEIPGTDVDVKARLIIALIDQKIAYHNDFA